MDLSAAVVSTRAENFRQHFQQVECGAATEANPVRLQMNTRSCTPSSNDHVSIWAASPGSKVKNFN